MIDKHGNICLSIFGCWDSNNTFVDCLEEIYRALSNPEEYLYEAINDEALFDLVDNLKQFERKARSFKQEFAMRNVSASYVGDNTIQR